jgi:hypothetical protein
MFFFTMPKENNTNKSNEMKKTEKSELTCCSYMETGPNFKTQIWFECETCKTFCCEFCKTKCHENHKLGPKNNSDFYCDCGCSSNCKSMTPKVFSIKKSQIPETIKQDNSILYIMAYFPTFNLEIQKYFETVLFQESKKEKNVRFFLVKEDEEFEETTFEFYKSNRELGFKEVTDEELEQQGLESTLLDLHLYFTANYLAHKNPVPLEFEGFEESESESEEDEPHQKKQKLNEEDEEYDEEEDEDFDPDQEEDEDEELEIDDITDVPTNMGTSQTISNEDLMPFWTETYQQLNLNTLLFTTFRNSTSSMVKELLFTTNPLMKSLAVISDPPAPDHRDLLEILKEATEFEDPNPEPSQETISSVNQLLKLKSEIKEWSDDQDYEFSEENNLEDSKNEWGIFGADLLRLTVGNWSVARDFKGQFRFKIDPVNKVIIYHMFHFNVEKKTISNKQECLEQLEEELKNFKESKQYKVVIPLISLSHVHYHASEVDPTLSLLVFDLKEKPKFFSKNVLKEEWNELEDFSENFQISKSKRHSILGYDEEFCQLIQLMNSISLEVLEKYNSCDLEQIEELKYFDDNDKSKKNENVPFLSNLEDVQENCCIQ